MTDDKGLTALECSLIAGTPLPETMTNLRKLEAAGFAREDEAGLWYLVPGSSDDDVLVPMGLLDDGELTDVQVMIGAHMAYWREEYGLHIPLSLVTSKLHLSTRAAMRNLKVLQRKGWGVLRSTEFVLARDRWRP